MRARLTTICRHPVKSIGYEELEAVALQPGQGLPHDREWAVAHAAAALGPVPRDWAPKMNFLRGAAAGTLMAVRARRDPDSGRLTLHHPERPGITVDPADPAGARALIDWVAPLWPAGRPAPDRLVRIPGQAMTDSPEPFVAVLGHASLRALSQRLGRPLSVHRWRGNLWLDGLAPWEEFDLIGRSFSIGEVRLVGRERIMRCEATMSNPESGRRDADTLGALEDGYGHRDFGIFAEVIAGGTVRLGDEVAWQG